MACVLHISAAGNQWWGKRPGGWVQLHEPDEGPVWALTDLAEESFVELSVPRIFGNDRRNYVERQLASRFPDTRFRLSMPSLRGAGLMERLAPPMEILAAIEPADKVDAALEGLASPLAGVWSTSMLLAKVGADKRMPADVLLVLSQPTGMRILFFKDRTPVLTRLVASSATAADQSLEILRTMRHLENTKVIERGRQRFGVLLLGVADGLNAILARDRLDALDPSILRKVKPAKDWQQTLLDMVCQNPPGQLAPVAFRQNYLGLRLGLAARWLAALCVLVTIGAVLSNVRVILRDHSERSQLEASIGELDNQLAQAQTAIEAFGIAPELLRSALGVDSEEITNAPNIQTDLVDLSHTISSVFGARAKSLQWRVLDAGETACADLSTPAEAATPAVPAGGDGAPVTGKAVEIKLTVALTDGAGPQQRQQQASALTQKLAQIPGVQLFVDPVKALREGALSAGSSQAEGANNLEWCLSKAAPAPKPQGAQP